jgi:hypothetical protein
MERSAKRSTLAYFALASLAIVAIAAGLPELRFKPGMALPEAENETAAVPILRNEGFSLSLVPNKALIIAVLATLATLVAVAAFRLLMKQSWKAVRAFLLKSLLTLGGVTLFLFILFNSFPRAAAAPIMPVAPLTAPESPRAPAPEAPLGLLAWLLAILAAGLVLALCWRLLADRRRAREGRHGICLEAEAARLALLAGMDFKDVIIGCYSRMSRDLESERGIEREASMTAREFEALLEAGGVPRESVHRLTLLFEAVRYGAWRPSPADEAEAIRCLEDIELFARKGKGEP